jgi:hypothetical protein
MFDPIPVVLHAYEVDLAAHVGVRRNVSAMAAGRRPAFGAGATKDWQYHVDGACGELAFAKASGRYWSGSVDTFRVGGDVGLIQVRTRSRDGYDLIVRDADRNEDAFVLVTGACPHFFVRGWCYGWEAKQKHYRRNHGERVAAYFVPQDALRDPRQLCIDPTIADTENSIV